MKPYYENNNGKLFLGDCLEVLPELEPVDLVLTDPPYGMSFISNFRHIKHEAIVGDNKLPIEEIILAINKATAAAYVFCRWDNLYEMPKPKSVLCWVKNNWSMGDLKHEHGRQWEAICFYNKEKHEFKKRIPDVLYSNRTGNDQHPTEKPVSLLIKIIDCNFADTVLDPFFGSGTTGVACEKLGRKWIGIEISEAYCEIAAKRIEAENKQYKMF